MKKIAVIARQKEYAKYLSATLEEYFGDYAEIKDYSLEDIADMEWIPAEYVAVSAFTIFQVMKNKIRKETELINISLSLNKSKLKQLGALPKGTRAYLVNIDYRTCMQVIMQLYEFGYRDLDLVPYYGKPVVNQDITIAITPDEVHMVPDGIEQIINLGERTIDAICIIDIAERLGIRNIFAAKKATDTRIKSLLKTTWAERLLGENESLLEQVNMLLGLIDQGIMITDVMGRIFTCNNKAKLLLKYRSEIIEGFNVTELLPEMDFYKIQGAEEEIITINGSALIISSTQIYANQEIRGWIVTLHEFSKVEEKQHNIRTKLSGSVHRATHNFEDIIGSSDRIIYAVETAKRMAKSGSSVLITGESGTGKEIFAQSIHNDSNRRGYNFVAVNCAAIPETLLESEMFGYEEGAFTGAKRGGRIGYFELAHNGTIFLDEIGEMPYQLQSKLLRVIEEKRITRVGSNKLIEVDIRIIAATNKNIYQLINENKFREDLYYRLNVLPLKLPSLRERRSDIQLLVEHFIETMRGEFKFNEGAMRLMLSYPWRGNIRELRNMIEYFENLGKEEIEEQDLMFVMDDALGGGFSKNSPGGDGIDRFIIQQEQRLDMLLFVLDKIEAAGKMESSVGRYALSRIARDSGLDFTERELRTCLTKLQEGKYIISKRGRGGSRLTDSGRLLYARLRSREG